MVLRSSRSRPGAGTLAIATCVLIACVVSSSALGSPTAGSRVSSAAGGLASPKPAAKGFCGGAKSLATLNSKTLKDVTSNVDVTSPGYVSKQFGNSLAALHVMYLHSPAAILKTSKEYLNAYIDYGKQIGEVHWKLQPTDPGEQKIVIDATHAYAPVATADLPKLDSFVKKTCGFGLNLVTAPK